MRKVIVQLIGGAAVLSTVGCASLSDLDVNSLSSALDGNLPSTEAASGTGDVANVLTIAQGFSVSDEEIFRTAQEAAMESDSENKIAPANNPYAVRLNKLVKKHFREDGLKLDFKVYLSPEVNAFALANGSIRVYSGLMDRLKDDELLSVIGHEIGHVKLGHSKNQISAALRTEGGVNMLTNYAGDKAAAKAGGLGKAGVALAGEGAKKIINSKFSRDDERSADDYGLQFLKRHSYDPQASVRALQKLAKMGGGEKGTLAFLTSSHPDPESRAERLAQQLGAPMEAQGSATMKASADITKTEVSANTAKDRSTSSPQAKAVKAPAVAETNSLGWAIQVAAEEEEVIAREKISALAEDGVKASLQPTIVKGKTYYRVLVGPYRSKSSAKEDLERITNFDIHHGTPFIRELKE
ncbi:MAG: M48 family metalloprotease [Deltaproteobacteria bacterium]|nr:M48 family metalloprotease [Deltaproteobacteria bacterium]